MPFLFGVWANLYGGYLAGVGILGLMDRHRRQERQGERHEMRKPESRGHLVKPRSVELRGCRRGDCPNLTWRSQNQSGGGAPGWHALNPGGAANQEGRKFGRQEKQITHWFRDHGSRVSWDSAIAA